MNPQEKQVLENFLNQLVQARVDTKDAQADALITAAITRQPDAAYLLVQRTLMLDQALAAARTQISSLQNELQAARASASPSSSSSGSFLDSANTWGYGASPRQGVSPVAQAQAMSTPAIPIQPASTPRSSFFGGFGSTLGNIATTAAGVAGGALLFQGIENLFHHNSGSGFFSQSAMGSAPTETIVNNFYEGDTSRDDGFAAQSDSNFLDTDLGNDNFIDDDSSSI